MPNLLVYINSKEVATIDTNEFINTQVGVLSANEADDISLSCTGYLGGDEIDNIINKNIRHDDVVDIIFGEANLIGEDIKTKDYCQSDDNKPITIFKLISSNGIELATSKTFSISQHIEISCSKGSDISTVLAVGMDFTGNEQNMKFNLPLNNSIKISMASV